MAMAADPDIVFHAGFHKTGTTSLQAALRLHAPDLAPLFGVETRATSPRLLAAAEAARDHSAAPTQTSLSALNDRLIDWTQGVTLQPGQGLLVSCEDFSGHMPGRFGVQTYHAALPVTAAIRSTLTARWPRCRLTFLFTTREPAGWLRSIHWQLSKHDELTLGPKRFARAFASAAAFVPLLADLRAHLAGTDVLDADLANLAQRRLGPVEALYDAARLPDDLRARLPVPPHANKAPPHDLARIFVKLNRSDLPRSEIRRLKRDMLAAENLLLGPGALFPVSNADPSG